MPFIEKRPVPKSPGSHSTTVTSCEMRLGNRMMLLSSGAMRVKVQATRPSCSSKSPLENDLGRPPVHCRLEVRQLDVRYLAPVSWSTE